MRFFFLPEPLQQDVRTRRGFPFNRTSPAFTVGSKSGNVERRNSSSSFKREFQGQECQRWFFTIEDRSDLRSAQKSPEVKVPQVTPPQISDF